MQESLQCSFQNEKSSHIKMFQIPLIAKGQSVSSSGFGTLPKDYQYCSDRGILAPLQACSSTSSGYKDSGVNGFRGAPGVEGTRHSVGDDPVRAHTIPRKQKLFAAGGHLIDGDVSSSSLLVDHWSTSAPMIGCEIVGCFACMPRVMHACVS